MLEIIIPLVAVIAVAVILVPIFNKKKKRLKEVVENAPKHFEKAKEDFREAGDKVEAAADKVKDNAERVVEDAKEVIDHAKSEYSKK